MHAEIVMIGTELLLGEIVDTNANRFGARAPGYWARPVLQNDCWR